MDENTSQKRNQTGSDICRFPAQVAIAPSQNLFAEAASLGYPLMLKQDFTAGGAGTYEAGDEASLQRLAAEHPDIELLSPNNAHLKAGRGGVLQQVINGRSASVSLAAQSGSVLGAFAYEKIVGQVGQTTPATVSRVVECTSLVAAAECLTSHFGFTGFGGIDFVIDHKTNLPFVLEFNARPTLTTHLGAVLGFDLCAALYASLTGAPPITKTPVLAPVIAMFPGEWRRDPSSEHLYQAYHDVPWDDAALLNAIFAREHGV